MKKERNFSGRLRSVGVVFVAIVCLLSSYAGRAHAGIFPVTTTAQSGSGSLRLAILGANASAGLDTISFNIAGSGPHTIQPSTPLPFITDALLIDGTTEPDFAGTPVVELDGVLSGPNAGLILATRGATLRALAINRFGAGGVEVRLDSSVIEGCYIGVALDGSTARSNAGNGITIFGSDNRIGGTTASARNVISGNAGRGILITVPTQVPNRVVQRNVISGNFIGTDATGTARLPNQLAGIVILDASSNVVGGLAPGSKNLISGNNSDGILVRGVNTSASGNVILGNYIGTAANGLTPLRNSRDGILVSDAANTTIGDTLASGGNLISGNAQYGVYLLGPKTTGSHVLGNVIGADSTGLAAMGNGLSGIAIRDASGNRVGGPQPGARNLISANGVFGVVVGLVVPGVTAQDTVQGNYIGTDATGASALPNGDSGIMIEGASQIVVSANLISGNTFQGVLIDGTVNPAAKTENNTVAGNLIGTDASGMAALANGLDGIKIIRSSGNQIGGMTAADRNVISGNSDHAIEISSFGASSANNVIRGNFIGLNAAGTALLPNASLGIFVVDSGASGTVVGGSIPGEGNVISGHQVNVALSSGNNTVQGNRIGTDSFGNVLAGRDSIGVWVINVANNSVGGSSAPDGNLIAGQKEAGILLINGSSDNLVANNVLRDNGGDGVRISQNGVRNTVQANSIFNNGALGIALGDDGVTPNDAGDSDSGPNNLQNFPSLTSAVDNGALTIGGELRSSPVSQFNAEFFHSTVCDPSGNGEGETFLGSTMVTTDASGKAVFSVAFQNASLSAGFVTATATDVVGNTSEFGNCVEIGSVPSAPQLVAPAEGETGLGTAVALRWRAAFGAIQYEAQVSEDSTFAQIVFEDSTQTDTSVVVSGLPNLASYYWRVRARNAVGWGPFSMISAFSVGRVPGAPQLLEPADGATALSGSVTFRWAAAVSAASYRLQVATDSSFSALVFEAAGVPDTSESVVGLPPHTVYYWRVRAGNVLGQGPYSNVFSFEVGERPHSPTLVRPDDNAVGEPVDQTFVWSSQPGISAYQLEVATASDFSATVFNDSTIADTSQAVQSLLSSTSYFWRVRAINPLGWGPYSAVRSFTTGAVLAAPVLIAPEDGAKDLPEDVTFTWSMVVGADVYDFQLATDSGLDTLVFEDSSAIDTSIVVKALEKGTSYFWRVRAGDSSGWGNFSSVRKFSIENVTSVEQGGTLPSAFMLEQNYPNPFNPQTTIGYFLPTSAYVQLDVFDVLGRKVAILVQEEQQAGHQQVVFDAANLANGVYVYRIRAGSFVGEYKMLLLK